MCAIGAGDIYPGVRVPRESSLTAFCIEQLRLNPDLTLPDLRARAQLEGVIVHSVSFHHARATLGLEPKRLRRARRQRPSDAPPAATEAPVQREDALDLDDVAGVIAAVRDERDRLRAALVQMRDVIKAALA